ncbi:MAG TPA: biopolymer transporter ExbD [Terriglobales bacterium]|nr:biopolymer transporter ExbD [Terriglobales bacterium]
MKVESGASRAPEPSINVTPLVDVVLVLLIIFLVITPLLAQRFWVHTPRQERRQVEQLPPADEAPLVLRIAADGALAINGTPLSLADFEQRLPRMFAARGDHVLFFDADDEVSYGFAVEVLDRARGSGAVTIALAKPLAADPAVARRP